MDNAYRDGQDEHDDRCISGQSVELGIAGVARILAIERIIVAAADSGSQTIVLGFLYQDNLNDHNAANRKHNACTYLNRAHNTLLRY